MHPSLGSDVTSLGPGWGLGDVTPLRRGRAGTRVSPALLLYLRPRVISTTSFSPAALAVPTEARVPRGLAAHLLFLYKTDVFTGCKILGERLLSSDLWDPVWSLAPLNPVRNQLMARVDPSREGLLEPFPVWKLGRDAFKCSSAPALPRVLTRTRLTSLSVSCRLRADPSPPRLCPVCPKSHGILTSRGCGFSVPELNPTLAHGLQLCRHRLFSTSGHHRRG